MDHITHNFPILTLEENAKLQNLYAYCNTIPQPTFNDTINGAEPLIPITAQTDSFNVGIAFLQNLVPNVAASLHTTYNMYSPVCEHEIQTVQEAYQYLIYQALMAETGATEEPEPVVKRKRKKQTEPKEPNVVTKMVDGVPIVSTRGRPRIKDQAQVEEQNLAKQERAKEWTQRMDNYRRRRETLELMHKNIKDQEAKRKTDIAELETQLATLKSESLKEIQQLRWKYNQYKDTHADQWEDHMYLV